MKIWIPALLICLMQGLAVDGKCLNTDSHLKSFFNYDGAKTLIIDSSDGITHNITSNIFKIYLEEELGYGAVSIMISKNRSFDPSLTRVSEIGGFKPEAMINMEVWLEPKNSIPWSVNVWNMGLLISLGRFGWFSSKKDLSWKDFQSSSPSPFQLPSDNYKEALEIAAARSISSPYDCDKCVNGTYTPQHCIGQTCAILLSGDYDSAWQLLNHINDLKLYIQVIWLGPDLPRVMDFLPRDWPLLVLTSFPNEVSIRRDQWYPVTFAACTDDNRAPGCLYETRRVIKLASGWVSAGAPLAFKALGRASFNRGDYMYLLNSSRDPSLSHYEIACRWFKKTDRWKLWRLEAEVKPKLSICGILPLSGAMSETGKGLVPAVKLAVKRINENKTVLPHHDLSITSHDGGCTSDLVMNTFINYVLESNARDLVGIIGPACSETVEPLIKLTKYFRTVVISYSAEGSSYSDRSQYPYFFRTIGANRRYKDVYFELFQRMGWKRMVALTEEGPKYAEYLSDLESIQSNKFQLIYQKKLPRERNNVTIRTKLDGFRTDNARIIVADVHDSSARAVMCEAYKQKMTAKDGYVWFLPQWLSKDWYYTSNRPVTESTCSDADMSQAIEGHFSLAHRYFAPDDQNTHEYNMTVGNWKKLYKELLGPKNITESNYAGFAYDAVWTYAFALDKLNMSHLSDIHSLDATRAFVDYINQTDFMGVSGRITFNRTEPSRPTIINILQWSSAMKKYVEVGYMNEEPFFNSGSNSSDLHMYMDRIVWFTKDGKQPTDGGEISNCAVRGLADLLDVDCSSAIIVANVIGFGLLAIVLVIVIAFTKSKYDKKMKKYQASHDYMRSIGFDKCPNENILDKEKWEIPRDCVVINRRLGEGAFGMVYGGELLLDKKGWVAAAVKTLKVTANSEQKLEFLAEAEMMKKFDHKNIVKLLGVCTGEEPVYTIMEFMLYGDLKTYLLNRRHLVTGHGFLEENNEVSCKRLTNMALGIARGLSYLASIKYVHRDLAARNCLLNSSRVVKISDFGLTRHMFDSDYYKFSRKGMLPVRWMARESMIDGLFTPQSDMWSMGVVLFEIITFGSYPFPGLTNAQVVDHVKAGNVVQLPKGVKTTLECLIKSCWKQDPKKRPTASEMVEFLANNPRVISPCLDQPTSYVALDDSDGLGLELGLQHSVPASPLDHGLNIFQESLSAVAEDFQVSRSASPFQEIDAFNFDPSRERLLSAPMGVNLPMSRISSRSASDENLEEDDCEI